MAYKTQKVKEKYIPKSARLLDQGLLVVQNGKGNKDRATLLPEPLHTPLKQHLQRVKTLHERDLKDGYGIVYLPHALTEKYVNAAKTWG